MERVCQPSQSTFLVKFPDERLPKPPTPSNGVGGHPHCFPPCQSLRPPLRLPATPARSSPPSTSRSSPRSSPPSCTRTRATFPPSSGVCLSSGVEANPLSDCGGPRILQFCLLFRNCSVCRLVTHWSDLSERSSDVFQLSFQRISFFIVVCLPKVWLMSCNFNFTFLN